MSASVAHTVYGALSPSCGHQERNVTKVFGLEVAMLGLFTLKIESRTNLSFNSYD